MGGFVASPYDKTLPIQVLQNKPRALSDKTLLEVANLIAVAGGDTTAHEVRQRARCHNCGVKGNNTYQMV